MKEHDYCNWASEGSGKVEVKSIVFIGALELYIEH